MVCALLQSHLIQVLDDSSLRSDARGLAWGTDLFEAQMKGPYVYNTPVLVPYTSVLFPSPL
eukprot:34489-Eustigmatos_ZCMA.PRE.1